MEYGIALVLLIKSAYFVYQKKAVHMDPAETQVSTGNQNITLRTDHMASPVYLTKPEPTLLLMDRQTTVKIQGLWDEEEYRSFYQTIAQGLAVYKKCE